MSQPFIGEIRMFGGNFAPVGWAFCAGQLLSISQNTALFSLIGTIYGGNGQTTFALPDLRGRVPIHQGGSPGTSAHSIGENGGSESVSLSAGHTPPHSHPFQVSSGIADTRNPAGAAFAISEKPVYSPRGSAIAINQGAIGTTGQGTAHENRQPFLCLNFIIALEGIYPSTN